MFDGCRREKLSYSVIKKNKEITSYLCVQKDVDGVGSFGICHWKELTENPACKTFLLIRSLFFTFRGYFLQMKAFTVEISKEQPSAFSQADLLCEKQTGRKSLDAKRVWSVPAAHGLLLSKATSKSTLAVLQGGGSFSTCRCKIWQVPKPNITYSRGTSFGVY